MTLPVALTWRRRLRLAAAALAARAAAWAALRLALGGFRLAGGLSSAGLALCRLAGRAAAPARQARDFADQARELLRRDAARKRRRRQLERDRNTRRRLASREGAGRGTGASTPGATRGDLA